MSWNFHLQMRSIEPIVKYISQTVPLEYHCLRTDNNLKETENNLFCLLSYILVWSLPFSRHFQIEKRGASVVKISCIQCYFLINISWKKFLKIGFLCQILSKYIQVLFKVHIIHHGLQFCNVSRSNWRVPKKVSYNFTIIKRKMGNVLQKTLTTHWRINTDFGYWKAETS